MLFMSSIHAIFIIFFLAEDIEPSPFLDLRWPIPQTASVIDQHRKGTTIQPRFLED